MQTGFVIDEVMTERKSISLSRDQYAALVRAKAEYEQFVGEEESLASFTKSLSNWFRMILNALPEETKMDLGLLLEVHRNLNEYGYDDVAEEMLSECIEAAFDEDEEVTEKMVEVAHRVNDPANLVSDIVTEAAKNAFEAKRFEMMLDDL